MAGRRKRSACASGWRRWGSETHALFQRRPDERTRPAARLRSRGSTPCCARSARAGPRCGLLPLAASGAFAFRLALVRPHLLSLALAPSSPSRTRSSIASGRDSAARGALGAAAQIRARFGASHVSCLADLSHARFFRALAVGVRRPVARGGAPRPGRRVDGVRPRAVSGGQRRTKRAEERSPRRRGLSAVLPFLARERDRCADAPERSGRVDPLPRHRQGAVAFTAIEQM